MKRPGNSISGFLGRVAGILSECKPGCGPGRLRTQHGRKTRPRRARHLRQGRRNGSTLIRNVPRTGPRVARGASGAARAGHHHAQPGSGAAPGVQLHAQRADGASRSGHLGRLHRGSDLSLSNCAPGFEFAARPTASLRPRRGRRRGPPLWSALRRHAGADAGARSGPQSQLDELLARLRVASASPRADSRLQAPA